MRILITSGGTDVPIDPVRGITNTSSGRFGAKLAAAALEANMKVIYLISRNGKSPFSETFDFYQSPDWETHIDRLEKLYQFSNCWREAYSEYRYTHFYEYKELLQKVVETEKPEIIMLAAAASDYLVTNYSENKIRSGKQLHIELQTAPKLVQSVKQWSGNSFVVGFKLLVDVKESELLEAGMRILKQNQLDLVIANDLSNIKKGAHEVLLIAPDGSWQKITNNIATTIITNILKRCT